jgi:hypothetical protein
MAPVLQCPECGTKHPLGDVPDAGAFPCKGCGRQLKVPEMVPRGAGSGAPGPAPAVPPVSSNPTVAQPAAPQATRMMPVVEHNPAPVAPATAAASAPKAAASAFAPVPIWMRALLWIVALPLSFIVVFALARALGLLTTNQLTDIYLAPGSDRFWPVARLLPVVALLTAALVQAGVIVLSRRRGRSKTRQPV